MAANTVPCKPDTTGGIRQSILTYTFVYTLQSFTCSLPRSTSFRILLTSDPQTTRKFNTHISKYNGIE